MFVGITSEALIRSLESVDLLNEWFYIFFIAFQKLIFFLEGHFKKLILNF